MTGTDLLLGDGLLAADRPADALEAYQQAAEIEPAYSEDPIVLHSSGGSVPSSRMMWSRQWKQRRRRNVWRWQPATADEGALMVQAELQRGQELWQSAIDLYQTVLELNPERSQAVRGLALALEGQERNQEAIVQWRAYLKLAPRGEYIDEAREHLRRLVNPTG